jgi:hypothetical protein
MMILLLLLLLLQVAVAGMIAAGPAASLIMRSGRWMMSRAGGDAEDIRTGEGTMRGGEHSCSIGCSM